MSLYTRWYETGGDYSPHIVDSVAQVQLCTDICTRKLHLDTQPALAVHRLVSDRMEFVIRSSQPGRHKLV
jgi:hypothetical protein